MGAPEARLRCRQLTPVRRAVAALQELVSDAFGFAENPLATKACWCVGERIG